MKPAFGFVYEPDLNEPSTTRATVAGIGKLDTELPYDRLAEGLLFFQIIGATFLQKFAIPFGGAAQLYLGLFIMLGATIAGLATQRLDIRGLRLALFLMMTGGLTLTQLLGQHDFSVLSLSLLLVAHIPYVFGLKRGTTRPGIELELFQKVMAVLAVLGILQYGMQFTAGWRYAFFLDSEFPQSFIFQGFHGLNPLGYGSHVYKSNGVFFLEPAIFCQMLAVAIVIDITHFHAWKRVALYLTAILATFSGTGLVILGVLVPVFLVQKRQYILLSAMLLVIATVGLWAPVVGLETVVGRVTEFSNSESSGYARFISSFRAIHDYILPYASTILCGMGAGSIKTAAAEVSYAMHDPSWAKVIFEYGVLGAFAYFPLMANIFLTSPRSAYIKAALAIQFLFLGEYVLSPTVHGLILALLAWPAVDSGKDER